MSDELIDQHLARLKMGYSTLDRTQLSKWVEQNTYLNGKRYSFEGHSFQRRIMDDPSDHKVIRKCSQVGLSETSLRIATGLMGVMRNFVVIYVLPTASFAAIYGKTRLNPVVMTSPALRQAVNSSMLDNQDVKQFGNNFLWMRGASSDTAPISVAADMVIVDEASFCNQEVVKQFHSRLSHSRYRWKIELSTPTWPGDPIDSAFQKSRRHWNMVKCHRCGHTFVPNYYEHVVVPGWSKHLDEITKNNLHLTNFESAYLACPHCGGAVDLGDEHREWVQENPSENWVATGYQVQPFDAPTIISIPYLVQSSTAYDTKSRFRQYNLGLPSEDAESGLLDEDLEAAGIDYEPGIRQHVLGIDLGLTCHFVVGAMAPDQTFVVVHYERVPLSQFRARFSALCAKYSISIKVADQQPYSDLVMQLCNVDPNMYGALFVTRNGMGLFDVQKREEDPDHALAGLRQVQINRGAMLDKLLAEVRDGNIKIRRTDEWKLLKSHMLSMKRSASSLRNGEFRTQWTKSSDGQDHYHFAVLFAYVAAQMRGIASGFSLPLMGATKFKVTGPQKRA